MSDNKFERFGKYLILDHLVDGGMAKICRARFLGEQSNKVVAIKMVQPQFSRDPSFVRMFQDELSVTFGLQHPNIAQTYDYGKVNEQLYTAMEYVDGANLKQFLDRLKEKKFVFPVEISVFIVSQICQGLHYAHTFTDKLSNQPLNIIHRDISPHNIMLTYDGAVKVIDFGIAKSNASSEQTQAGTIKGKLSYLAPEYLEGLELDARYDQFAVGITLWEMLCSRKMFTAANDLAVLKQIQACKIAPPSSINPNVPKELDAIVMKALSKDRSQRYDDLDKMNRALVKFLYAKYPDFNPSDLNYFAQELFKEEIKTDKQKFIEYGKIDVAPYIEEMNRANDSGNGNAVAETPAPGEPQVNRQERIELDMDLSPGTNIPGSTASIELAMPTHTGTKKIKRASVNQGPKTLTGQRQVSIKSPRIQEKTSFTRSSVKSKKQILAEVESKEAKGSKNIIIILVASLVGFAYLQADFVESMTGFNLHHVIHGEPQRSISSVDPTPSIQQKKSRKQRVPQGGVMLNGFSYEMELYINGKKREHSAGTTITLPLDQNFTFLVKKPGYKTFIKTVTLNNPDEVTKIVIPDMPRSKTGLLSSSLNYGSGTIMKINIDGEVIEQRMPFKEISIPEGTYDITVVNPDLGTEKKVELVIEENKMHLLE